MFVRTISEHKLKAGVINFCIDTLRHRAVAMMLDGKDEGQGRMARRWVGMGCAH